MEPKLPKNGISVGSFLAASIAPPFCSDRGTPSGGGGTPGTSSGSNPGSAAGSGGSNTPGTSGQPGGGTPSTTDIPNTGSSTIPLLQWLLGGLTLAAAAAGLLTGSGKPPQTTTKDPATATTDTGTGTEPAPTTTDAGTQPTPTTTSQGTQPPPQTTSGGGTPPTPTTTGQDTIPTPATTSGPTPQASAPGTQSPGSWGSDMSQPTASTASGSNPGQTVAKPTTPATTTKDGTPATTTGDGASTPPPQSVSAPATTDGSWGVSGTGPVPATVAGMPMTTSKPEGPQTVAKGGDPASPGTAEKPAQSTTPGTTSDGSWGVTGTGPTAGTSEKEARKGAQTIAKPGDSSGPGTTEKPTGGPTSPGTTEKPAQANTPGTTSDGSWGVTGTGPTAGTSEKEAQKGAQTVAKPGGSGGPATAEKPTGGTPGTQTKPDGATTGDGTTRAGTKDDGTWGIGGTGPVAGSTEKGGQPPAQTAGKDPAPQAVVPKPGDLNEGGGHTFSRGTKKEDLVEANRPPTAEELAAAKPGTGPDEYATREKKLQIGMGMKRIAEESAPPIAVHLDKPWIPTEVKPFVPTTQEDIDRLKYIDKKIDEATTRAAAATNPKEAQRQKNLAKFWTQQKKFYGTMSKPFKDEIDTLKTVEDHLTQAKANGDGPTLVDDYAAFIGQTTSKIPGIKQIFQTLGFSDKGLEEYGNIAKLERMTAEHEYLVYLYGTQGATAVSKYLDDQGKIQLYGAAPGIVAGGAVAGVEATGGALNATGAAIAPKAGESRAGAPETVSPEEPSAPTGDDEIMPDWSDKPEDSEGGWDTRMPWDYEDDSPPILHDPNTGEPVPANVDPKTGALTPQNAPPSEAAPSTTSGAPKVDPDSPTQALPDPNATQEDILPHDSSPAKGMQKTAYENFNKVPVDSTEKPGTRMPYKEGRAALNDPTDVPIDPQTEKPILEKTQVLDPPSKK